MKSMQEDIDLFLKKLEKVFLSASRT